jgi:hypothetical protein
VEAQAEEHPALGLALADGGVACAARRATTLWRAAWLDAIAELRRSDAVLRNRLLTQAERAYTALWRALVTRHSTFAVFLSEPLDGVQRWQMWVALMTVIASQLLVNIWMCAARAPSDTHLPSGLPACLLFAHAAPAPDAPACLRTARFYAKAANCCAEVRAILAAATDVCEAAPAACAGDCATLPAVFATTPLLPHFPAGLADYTCHAFPDDDMPTDSLIVALISIAIALPVSIFLASCFAIANDSEAPESWLTWRGLAQLLAGRGANRRWHYTGPAGQPAHAVRWFIRSGDAPKLEMLIQLGQLAYARLTCAQPPWALEAAEAEAAAAKCGDADGLSGNLAAPSGANGASALELQRKKRTYTAVGIAGIYLVWAIFAWCVRAPHPARLPAPRAYAGAPPALLHSLQVHLHMYASMPLARLRHAHLG